MAEKPDISGQFVMRKWQRGNYVYQETSGELGVPGEVKTHFSRSENKAVSSGTGGHASHQVAREFGAPGTRENLTLQNPNINTYTPKEYQTALGKGGNFRVLEEYWKVKQQQGYRIRVRVLDVFRVGETRPFQRQAEWTETDSANLTAQPMKRIFGNFSSPQERSQQNNNTTVDSPPAYRSETEPLVPLEPAPPTQYINVPTVNSALGRVLGNQGAVAMLGQALGSALMWLNHRNVSKQAQEELQRRHSQTIQESFDRGEGVLVIVRIRIFAPLPDSVPTEELISVSVVPGATREAALSQWIREPKIMENPAGPQWSINESYGWLSPGP
jgi:hypothetical protein